MAEIVGIVSGAFAFLPALKYIYKFGKKFDELRRQLKFARYHLKNISKESQMFGDIMKRVYYDTAGHPDLKEGSGKGDKNMKKLRQKLMDETSNIYEQIKSFLHRVKDIAKLSGRSGVWRNFHTAKALWRWLRERTLFDYTLRFVQLVKSSADIFLSLLIFRDLRALAKEPELVKYDLMRSLQLCKADLRAKRKSQKKLQKEMKDLEVELVKTELPFSAPSADALQLGDELRKLAKRELRRERNERRERGSNVAEESTGSSSSGPSLETPTSVPSPQPPRPHPGSIVSENARSSKASNSGHVRGSQEQNQELWIVPSDIVILPETPHAAADNPTEMEIRPQTVPSAPPSTARSPSPSYPNVNVRPIGGVPTALFRSPESQQGTQPDRTRSPSVEEGYVHDNGETVEDGYRRGRRRSSRSS
ncbi:hypothetical protein L228DRAFT_85954 [Xylona heveae TC161]|uniref:Uncharacterized protein n=1 Tax=Xylona heveae (strain CBS 132557 / TC161) TaxID=1328760 RepID=A0A165HV97_XYLHT|nr:hypothetical protein L228DRAFT_85954 [Xylona heveae TC161]KZF23970.1 hypothetical protein L228DRAFT_85954 [Xylona heveae TC161]